MQNSLGGDHGFGPTFYLNGKNVVTIGNQSMKELLSYVRKKEHTYTASRAGH